MTAGAFDIDDEIFADDDFVELDAMTYLGNPYNIIRHAEEIETEYTQAGARNATVLPVDVQIKDFTAGEPKPKELVVIDGITRRIRTRKTSSTNRTYRLILDQEHSG